MCLLMLGTKVINRVLIMNSAVGLYFVKIKMTYVVEERYTSLLCQTSHLVRLLYMRTYNLTLLEILIFLDGR